MVRHLFLLACYYYTAHLLKIIALKGPSNSSMISSRCVVPSADQKCGNFLFIYFSALLSIAPLSSHGDTIVGSIKLLLVVLLQKANDVRHSIIHTDPA